MFLVNWLVGVAHAAADASMSSSSEAVATAVKENVIAGIGSATFLGAAAIAVSLVIVIYFAVRLFKRIVK